MLLAAATSSQLLNAPALQLPCPVSCTCCEGPTGLESRIRRILSVATSKIISIAFSSACYSCNIATVRSVRHDGSTAAAKSTTLIAGLELRSDGGIDSPTHVGSTGVSLQRLSGHGGLMQAIDSTTCSGSGRDTHLNRTRHPSFQHVVQLVRPGIGSSASTRDHGHRHVLAAAGH